MYQTCIKITSTNVSADFASKRIKQVSTDFASKATYQQNLKKTSTKTNTYFTNRKIHTFVNTRKMHSKKINTCVNTLEENNTCVNTRKQINTFFNSNSDFYKNSNRNLIGLPTPTKTFNNFANKFSDTISANLNLHGKACTPVSALGGGHRRP